MDFYEITMRKIYIIQYDYFISHVMHLILIRLWLKCQDSFEYNYKGSAALKFCDKTSSHKDSTILFRCSVKCLVDPEWTSEPLQAEEGGSTECSQ